MPTTAETYERVTSQIIKALDTADPDAWKKLWRSVAVAPKNVAGKKYRGANVLALAGAAMTKGYAVPLWGTFQQWKERGAMVRKGETASQVIFWKFFDKPQYDDSGNLLPPPTRRPSTNPLFTRNGKIKGAYAMAKLYHVFNVAQVDNFAIPAEYHIEPTTAERNERAEGFFQSIGANVRHGGNRACYSPELDAINMPSFDQFQDAGAYYAVLAHELTHWTGHPERLNRTLATKADKEHYAAEELIAELGAAFICAHLQIDAEPRQDHVCYLANWLQAIKADPAAIVTAAAAAQKAADYLIERGEGSRPAAEDTAEDAPETTAAEPQPAAAAAPPPEPRPAVVVPQLPPPVYTTQPAETRQPYQEGLFGQTSLF